MAGGNTGEERTEAPTPKRIKELRKKNTVFRSQEWVQFVGLLLIVATAPMLMMQAWVGGLAIMRKDFSEAGILDPKHALDLLGSSFETMALAVAAPVGLVLLGVILAGMLLTKGRPNPYAIKPRPDLLNPKMGVKKIFGVQGLVETGKGTVKLLAVAAACYTLLPAAYMTFMEGPPSVEDFIAELMVDMRDLAWRLVAIGGVVAVFDLWWSRRTYFKQARMTKTELKQEYKQSEGDPMIKAQRRQMAARRSRERMMADVPTANVVLANPTHIAVALRYREGDLAPVVVARGAGLIAERIKQLARDAGIPVREDKPLARSLYRACRVGDVIPVELYAAVAVVLAEVMRAKRRSRR